MNKIIFHTRVKQDVKRLGKPVRTFLTEHVFPTLSHHPDSGESLTGDFSGCFSHHVRYQGTHYRIAYEYLPDDHLVRVIMIGTRENFYHKLKRRLS